MSRYSVNGAAAAAANKTQIELRSATTVRPRIYHLWISSHATPDDNVAELVLKRTTTAGSGGSTMTPALVNPADPRVAICTCRYAHTGEPTYTAGSELLAFAFNQRSSPQWMAYPDGELYLPAADNGLGLLCLSVAPAGFNGRYQMFFED
jgi:hypothetical protein